MEAFFAFNSKASLTTAWLNITKLRTTLNSSLKRFLKVEFNFVPPDCQMTD